MIISSTRPLRYRVPGFYIQNKEPLFVGGTELLVRYFTLAYPLGVQVV